MAVILTEKAAEQIKKFRTEHEFSDQSFLRIGVVGGGCSGLDYAISFDDRFDETKDSRYEQHGVSVVVDKKSALYLDGTKVDWYQSFEKQGFVFDNPNATKTCGCGKSFQA
jgi:iron-sulfur cluster assembly protein